MSDKMVVVYDAGHRHIGLQRVLSTRNPPPALAASVTTFSILVTSAVFTMKRANLDPRLDLLPPSD